MTKVLCNAENCEHNFDWQCLKNTIHIKQEFYEANRTDGWYQALCKDFKEKSSKSKGERKE